MLVLYEQDGSGLHFYSIYFLIYKEAFRVLCAMAADKATQELSLKVLEHLSAAQATLKANQRKAVIASEASKFKNAATKRNVRYNRELLDNIEDMEDIFKVEEGAEFVTADTLEEANQAVVRFRELLEMHKRAVQHELNMVIVADASPLKWKTVSQLEGGLELPSTIGNAEVRKAERDCMAFSRELLSARNASKRLNQEAAGNRAKSFRGGSRGRGGSSGRGGAVSNGSLRGSRACFKCGDTSHLIAQCDK